VTRALSFPDPAALEDAAAALSWVAAHAHEYGADPQRLVLAGESAGANLVTALAYLATHRREEPWARAIYDRKPSIVGVLANYGVYDLRSVMAPRPPRRRAFDARRRLIRTISEELIWGARTYVDGRPDLAPLASPLNLLEEPVDEGQRPLPPFFIAVGERDPLVGDSRRLATVRERRGAEADLLVFPGEVHGFNALLWRPAARDKWRAAFRFLKKHASTAATT
jgi:acetyl esterase